MAREEQKLLASSPTDESFDLIVADLYRAAAGAVPWASPLTRIAEQLDAFGVQVHGVRRDNGAVAFSHEAGGFPAEAVLEYIRHWHRLDPRAALVAGMPTGQWISCHQEFDDEQVANEPFYQHFLIPHGGRYVSGTKVYQDDELIAFFGVHRGHRAQPLEAPALALAQRFGVHLHAALTLWRRQQGLLAHAAVGHALLEHFGHPVLLVDEQLQVVQSNALASRALADDVRLAVRGGVLSNPGGQANLLHAVRRLLAPAGEADGASDKLVLHLASVRGESPLVLVLIALRPDATMGAFGPRPLALALVHDPRARAQPDPFIVAASFDLTPAEARVAVRVAGGEAVDAVAADLGIRMSTARTHLRNVFAKTGVTRIPELVAVLAALPGAGVEVALR